MKKSEDRAVAEAIQRKVRATQGTIFPNGKLSVKAGLKVTENNRLSVVFSTWGRSFGKVRVKRQGKSLPPALATAGAVPPMGCKVKYTGAIRAARPIAGGWTATIASGGDEPAGQPAVWINDSIEQNPAYRSSAFLRFIYDG